MPNMLLLYVLVAGVLFVYFGYRMIRWQRRECKKISKENAAFDAFSRRTEKKMHVDAPDYSC
jgi:uncharacterized membrane protein